MCVCQRERDGRVVPTSAKRSNIGGRRKMLTKSQSSTFPANSGSYTVRNTQAHSNVYFLKRTISNYIIKLDPKKSGKQHPHA